MFRIEEKDGYTYITSSKSKKLLCVLENRERPTGKNGRTFIETKIVAVHDRIRKRELARLNGGKSKKENNLGQEWLLEEEELPPSKENFFAGLGLSQASPKPKESALEVVIPRYLNEDIPFSSLSGRKTVKVRPSSITGEIPRYERHVNRKAAIPMDCITYPHVFRGTDAPQLLPNRTFLFGKRIKDEVFKSKRKQRLTRRSKSA